MSGLAHSGAVLGFVLGLGLALVWLGPPRHRRAGLAGRVLPYLRDTPRPSRLLDDGRPAGGAFGVVAGPVIRDLGAVVELLKNGPMMLQQAHVLVEYGAGLSRMGDKSVARSRLQEGLELACRFDAQPLVLTAQRELRLIGFRPRRTASTGPDSLTASELRVASLAADGATNRQIAQALFVTARTVEVHLTSAYRS